MTEQEKRIEKQTKDAIEVLGFLKKDFENKAKPRCKFARVRAGLFFGIKALEKQIAKKPHHISEIDDNDNAMVECPICHANSDYSVNTIKSGYCWKCGQKLDWE